MATLLNQIHHAKDMSEFINLHAGSPYHIYCLSNEKSILITHRVRKEGIFTWTGEGVL